MITRWFTSIDVLFHILGNDSIINCLHSGPIPENVINNYCYIQGTFTIPKHYAEVEYIKNKKTGRYEAFPQIGNVISSAGVGPYNAGSNPDGSPITEVEVKAYYQWVPFMLFLQGVMFYVPHLIYKAVEGGKLKVFQLNPNFGIIIRQYCFDNALVIKAGIHFL